MRRALQKELLAVMSNDYWKTLFPRMNLIHRSGALSCIETDGWQEEIVQ